MLLDEGSFLFTGIVDFTPFATGFVNDCLKSKLLSVSDDEFFALLCCFLSIKEDIVEWPV
jgi:hypothetical protein